MSYLGSDTGLDAASPTTDAGSLDARVSVDAAMPLDTVAPLDAFSPDAFSAEDAFSPDAAMSDAPSIVRAVSGSDGLPDPAGCTPFDLAVHGSAFESGMRVYLVDAAGGRFEASSVTRTSGTELRATFVLAGAAVGTADLHTVWGDGEDLASPLGVTIATSPYAGAVFVDGDVAPSGDGSRERPFATVAAGLSAAGAGRAVLVDGSAAPYAPFALRSDRAVIGCPWSAGESRPVVAVSGRHVLGTAVSNVTVERLDFVLTVGAAAEGLVISGGSAITIRDCGFSGTATGADVVFLLVDSADGVEIAESWLHGLHHTGAPSGTRVLRALRVADALGFTLHHSELSDVGFAVPGTAANSILEGVRVSGSHDLRIHHVLVHDLFARASGTNHLSAFGLSNINSFDWVGVFELHNVTIDDLRHADTPGDTTVTAGHVNGGYFGSCGGTRVWRDNIVAHLQETNDAMMAGSSSYYGFWVDGLLMPAPSPQPMSHSLVFDVGTPLPSGANSFGWAEGFVNQVSVGTGSVPNRDAVDPMFELTPGPRYYHPNNPRIAMGASDGGEMGAFGGGPSWTPPSQRSR